MIYMLGCIIVIIMMILDWRKNEDKIRKEMDSFADEYDLKSGVMSSLLAFAVVVSVLMSWLFIAIVMVVNYMKTKEEKEEK